MNIFKQVARNEHFIEHLLCIRYGPYLIFKMSWQVLAHLMSEEMKNKGCYISLSGTAGNRIKLV